MKLSGQQLERYVEEGYVVVEGGLTEDDLEPVIGEYADIVDEIARDLHSQARISRLYDDEPFETRFARIAAEDEVIYHAEENLDIGATRRRATFEILRNENLLDLVEGFVGPEITCNSIGHIRAKFPTDEARARLSNVAGWHQDAVFTTMEAHHILQMTVWFPLCDATEENGCLQVRPGVHKGEVVYWGGTLDPTAESVAVPMKKGDVIFIHKLTPHASGPNTTDGIRWSMDIRYQKTGELSPRPEWPSVIARSRRDPSIETNYEDWRDAWAQALEKAPRRLQRERPTEPQPYTGEMYLSE